MVILSSSVFFNRRRALGGTGAGPDRDAYQQKNGSHGRPSRITLSAWASASRACRWYQYCAHISKDDERHTTPSTRSWPTGTGTGAAEVNAATTSCYQLSISFRSSSLLTGGDECNDCKPHSDTNSSCVDVQRGCRGLMKIIRGLAIALYIWDDKRKVQIGNGEKVTANGPLPSCPQIFHCRVMGRVDKR